MAIATFFAPALWLLNTPDRFDVYSLGQPAPPFLDGCKPPRWSLVRGLWRQMRTPPNNPKKSSDNPLFLYNVVL